jgi:hypothetical protein
MRWFADGQRRLMLYERLRDDLAAIGVAKGAIRFDGREWDRGIRGMPASIARAAAARTIPSPAKSLADVNSPDGPRPHIRPKRLRCCQI